MFSGFSFLILIFAFFPVLGNSHANANKDLTFNYKNLKFNLSPTPTLFPNQQFVITPTPTETPIETDPIHRVPPPQPVVTPDPEDPTSVDPIHQVPPPQPMITPTPEDEVTVQGDAPPVIPPSRCQPGATTSPDVSCPMTQ